MKILTILLFTGLLGLSTAAAQPATGRSNRLSLGDQPAAHHDTGQPADTTLTPGPPANRTGKTRAAYSWKKLPALSVRLNFIEPGDNVLDAEETGTIRVQARNGGAGTASKLKLRITPVDTVAGIILGTVPEIGDLTANASRVVEIPVTASTSVATGRARYRIEILEKNGFDLDPPAMIAFRTRAFSPPRLTIVDYMTEGEGGTNIIKPRELVEITARIQNRGRAVAKNASVDITAGEGIFFEEGTDTHQLLGDLKPGEYKDVKFSCYANNRARSMPLFFSLKESRGRYDTTASLELALNKPQRHAMEFIAEARQAGAEQGIDDAPALAVDVDVNLPSTHMSNPDAVAVVIGNPDYQKARRVDFALRDATSIRRYLVDVMGYRDDNVVFLANATKSDFELYFGTRDDAQGKLYNLVKPGESDVFIYYAGHGAPGMRDHKGYFVPVECDPNYVELQGYSLDTFYANLARLNARSVSVVLDACFSGADLVRNVSPLLLKMEAGAFPLANGAALSSSKGDQVSSWYNEKQHSLFTYFFLKGIHDRAADLNNDGQITLEEIFKYLTDRDNGVPYYARRINGVEQTPTVQGKAGDRVIVRY